MVERQFCLFLLPQHPVYPAVFYLLTKHHCCIIPNRFSNVNGYTYAETSGSVHPLLYSVTVAACTSNFALLFNLCCTREKQKAENKDRKVLEILQAKDYRIQELEQVL